MKSKAVASVAAVAIAVAIIFAAAAIIVNNTEKRSDCTISASGAVLNGGTYDDIYITEDVGDGTVTLNDVTVKGTVYVEGGGSNSILFTDCSIKGTVDVYKKGGEAPRIFAENTSIPELISSVNVILESSKSGTFGNVNVKDSTLTVKGIDTEVSTVVSSGKMSIIVNGASVASIAQESGELSVESSGNIKKVDVRDVSLTVKGKDTKIEAVTVSGDTSLTVNDTSLQNVEQKDGKLNVDGSGAISSLSSSGSIKVKSSVVSVLKIMDHPDDSSIVIDGDDDINVLVSTDKKTDIDTTGKSNVILMKDNDVEASVTVNDKAEIIQIVFGN